MSFDLRTGIRVKVRQPQIPRFTVAPPTSPRITVLPVRGPAGLPGAPGGAYVHTQATPAATWTVQHNLGRKPALTLLLTADLTEPVYTDVHYPDDNTAVVEWPTPETGIAYA